MSALYNEYIIASNNSINENKYNDAKLAKSTSHKIKKILKPILRMLRQKNNKKQSSSASSSKSNSLVDTSCSCCEYEQPEDFWACEVDENSANEELESRIFREIEQCSDDAAVYVYNNDECELQSVHADQKFVPVHFARTEAGTFFWTTMQKPVDYELVQPTYCCSGYQIPQLQYGDRWVQA